MVIVVVIAFMVVIASCSVIPGYDLSSQAQETDLSTTKQDHHRNQCHNSMPKESEISRVRSKNNYTTYNTGPIYEDVSGLSMEHRGEDHDYDIINSVSVGPNDDPKSYEVPQTNPKRVSPNPESLVYAVPGDILSADDTSSVK